MGVSRFPLAPCKVSATDYLTFDLFSGGSKKEYILKDGACIDSLDFTNFNLMSCFSLQVSVFRLRCVPMMAT